MISIEELREEIKNIGYYADDALIYKTYNALSVFKDKEVSSAQDIFAMCLEGPAGAGKTLYAKVYARLANKIIGEDVLLVSYQCNNTTGFSELFEDVNISAAIRRDADNVNIPGKIVQAIKAVNEGKKVVLFIDEYDKAREETDDFFLQLIQDGKINSVQHGDLEVKPEYKGNLHIILCKNDKRTTLSGPLSRRLRIVRLDYMKPEVFYEVAHRELIENRKENKVDESLINLVTLMYKRAYSNRDLYTRLPSCPEMLIALEDADRLVRRANAPKSVMYNEIVNNMFKCNDDIVTFESSLDRVASPEESSLTALIQYMKLESTDEAGFDINNIIAEKVYADKSKKLNDKINEMQSLIDEYRGKFAEMEKARKETVESEIREARLKGNNLIHERKAVIRNFDDETMCVKRGCDIFDTSLSEWFYVGEVCIPFLSHSFMIEKASEFANKLGITIYENGIMLTDDDDIKLIVVSEMDDNKNVTYKFMSNQMVIPSVYIKQIEAFIKFLKEVYGMQPVTTLKDKNCVSNNHYKLDCFCYNDLPLSLPLVSDNVYSVSKSVSSLDVDGFAQISSLTLDMDGLKCDDIGDVISASKRLSGSILNRKNVSGV